MKEKLRRIRSPWRRRLVSLFLSLLVLLGSFRGPRAYFHWVGSRSRPLRIERPFFFIVFFGAMLMLETHQYLLWSIIWGAGFSLFVILDTAITALSASKGEGRYK